MTPEVFGLSSLINGLVAFSLGVFVLWNNWKSKINRLYFLMVVSITIWALSYWRWMISDNAGTALFWVRMLSIGSTLIPIFYFHWVVSLLKLEKKQKYAVRLVYFLASLFLIFSFSDLFIKGVRAKAIFSFWPDPGILYHFYIFFAYVLLIFYALYLLLKEYRVAGKEKRGQIIFVFLGTMIASGGGLSNFFLWYDIPILPYGNLLVVLYPFFYGYAILKHHLFDIKVIATEMITGVIWIFLLIKVIFSKTINDFIVNGSLLVFIVIFGILLIRSVIREVELRERIKRAYEVEKEARKQVEELTEAKTQFIMATQHHLRTPLTSMIGYLDLLFGGTYGKVPPKIKETLLKFQVSTRRLIRVVNALLDISQFQMGKRVVALEPGVDFESLIKEVMEELRFEVKIRNLYFKYEKIGKVPTIKADSEKLKVALFNIIDNAIKYTKQGGITVNLKQVGKSAQLSVRDTGIGIDSKEAKKLFKEAFARGDEAKKVHGFGRGIGVYITGHIIRAHNGKIWAESQGKGKGTCFFIELPVG